jgi:hypothetical protein
VGGWEKSKLKLNSAQLKLEFGLSLAKITPFIKVNITQARFGIKCITTSQEICDKNHALLSRPAGSGK